jgi:hypothetical protein
MSGSAATSVFGWGPADGAAAALRLVGGGLAGLPRLGAWAFGAAPGRSGLGALALLQEHGDRRVDLHALGAGGDQDLAERALIDGLDFHRRLVGLDLGDDVAGLDLVAFVLQPLGKVALFHRRREGGHQDIDAGSAWFREGFLRLRRRGARAALEQDVGPELGRIRLGIVLANSAASATMSRTSLSIFLRSSSVAHFLLEEARLHLLDRVVLGAHLLHLVLRAVLSPGRTWSGRDSGRSASPGCIGPLPERHHSAPGRPPTSRRAHPCRRPDAGDA